jgi:hypothetical protein
VSGTYWDCHYFREEALESTGFAEADVGRVPLNRDEHVDSFLELTVGLFVPITREPLDHLRLRAQEACAQLLPNASIETGGRVDSGYPDHWWIWLEIRPSEASRDAFELLAASFDHWQRQWDTGWSCAFRWWRVAAEAGEQGFLLPEADSVFLDLLPYSDPNYGPVPRGRNESATTFEEQLIGLPPPAGYTSQE